MIDAVVNLLRFAAPVGLAATGETVGQKAGVINIGLEGMMLVSSYAGVVASQSSGSPWFGLLVAVMASVVLAVVQGFFTISLQADQVVAGTAINLFALGLTGTLYRARFGASGQLLSVPKIPRLGPGFDALPLFWIASLVVVSWALYRTKWGLALRASGEFPPAVEAAGYSPNALRWQAVLIGGLFAGLAGAHLALGISGSFAENMTVGRGFVALAMVTFGRWKPVWVFAASLLIGYADSLQFELQALNIGLPPQFFIALPYALALAVLVFVGKGTAVPAALGQPYRRQR